MSEALVVADNAAAWAEFDRVLGLYERARADVQAAGDELRDVHESAESEDGLVRVTVGPRGTLTDLKISERGIRRLGPSRLAEVIVETNARAVAAMNARVERVLGPFLPKNVSYDDLLSGRADISQWMPAEPLTTNNFDEWFGQFGRRADDSER
jgi:DNA-binding protein YbaB